VKRPPSALWCVHKPAGVTSASLVEDFRRAHAGNFTLKVSHGGVLDPFAEGLVILLVGAANRLFEALHEAPKTYVAGVRFGVETDTGDAGGRVLRVGDPSAVTPGRVEEALRAFRGWTDQVPPATSNKRVGGERAYARAHRGEQVVLPAQRVFLQEAAFDPLSASAGRGRLRLVVRGGFYVRSLVTDLGRALGCGAHVETLERTAIGRSVDPRPGPVEVTGRDALPWLPSMELSDAQWGALKQGALPAGPVTPPAWPLPAGFPPATAGVRAFHRGRLVALLREGGPLLLPGGL
jgi:tRNA pseudouridine55 synthase